MNKVNTSDKIVEITNYSVSSQLRVRYKSNIMRWLRILPAAIIPYDNFNGDRQLKLKLKHLLREQLNIYDKKYRITYCIGSLLLLFWVPTTPRSVANVRKPTKKSATQSGTTTTTTSSLSSSSSSSLSSSSCSYSCSSSSSASMQKPTTTYTGNRIPGVTRHPA